MTCAGPQISKVSPTRNGETTLRAATGRKGGADFFPGSNIQPRACSCSSIVATMTSLWIRYFANVSNWERGGSIRGSISLPLVPLGRCRARDDSRNAKQIRTIMMDSSGISGALNSVVECHLHTSLWVRGCQRRSLAVPDPFRVGRTQGQRQASHA
jgi:hypothetical protein